MKRWIKGGMVYQDHRFAEREILIEDGQIQWIGSATDLDLDGAEVLDASGQWILPGFFDIHTHGAANVDVNGATAEDLEKICCFFASCGTTSWLCSVLTDTKEQTLWCIEQYNRWKQMEHRGAILEGIHLEGPFLSAEYKGAMPEHLLLKADLSLLQEYQRAAKGGIRYITVSPEVEGIPEMIPEIRKLGISVAIGHSGADYQTALKAIENGAVAATHTGNAMKLLHQHFPAIFGAVLEKDSVYAEMICDGRHLHPGVVRLIIKTKGLDRVVAVTDSIMAAGLPDGKYRLGVNDVVVKDKDATLASNGVRAGSTLTMEQALQNLLEFSGKKLEEIALLFTENPARVIGLEDRIGKIAEKRQANLVFLNQQGMVVRTLVNGKTVFDGEKSSPF